MIQTNRRTIRPIIPRLSRLRRGGVTPKDSREAPLILQLLCAQFGALLLDSDGSSPDFDLVNDQLSARMNEIQEKIAAASAIAGRKPDVITIIAVTKTFPPEIVKEALTMGLTHIGENRIQEAERKVEVVRGKGIFHLIGNLQSNKVKKAVSMFDWIQTIDDFDVAAEISKRAVEQNRSLQVLIEVNSSGEPQKHGAEPDEVLKIAERVMSLPQLTLRGLMTVGPLTDDESQIKRAFAQTNELFESIKQDSGSEIDTLSMGMSDDYELAIREGSTMIRLGSILFGRRNADA